MTWGWLLPRIHTCLFSYTEMRYWQMFVVRLEKCHGDLWCLIVKPQDWPYQSFVNSGWRRRIFTRKFLFENNYSSIPFYIDIGIKIKSSIFLRIASTLGDDTIFSKEYLCLQIPVSKEFNIIYTVKEQMIHFHLLETDLYNNFKFSVCHYHC